MEPGQTIAGWRDFYGAAANASAALVGLVFVGVSIQLSQRPLGSHQRGLAVESLINLLHPLWAALIALSPVAPPVLGAGFALLSVGSGIATAAIWRAQVPRARLEPGLVFAYRYLVPVVAAVLLAAGALGMMAGWAFAVYAPAAFVYLMFLAGTQNVWALLLASRGGQEPEAPR